MDRDEMRFEIEDLVFGGVLGNYEPFFDLESDENMERKLEILRGLKNGKAPADFDDFYDILELYPMNGEMWD